MDIVTELKYVAQGLQEHIKALSEEIIKSQEDLKNLLIEIENTRDFFENIE